MRLRVIPTIVAIVVLLGASGLALNGPTREAAAVEVLCPGDFDEDGVVTGRDIGVWGRSAFTMEGDPRYSADADANGDGTVNMADFAAWHDNFGTVCS